MLLLRKEEVKVYIWDATNRAANMCLAYLGPEYYTPPPFRDIILYLAIHRTSQCRCKFETGAVCTQCYPNPTQHPSILILRPALPPICSSHSSSPTISLPKSRNRSCPCSFHNQRLYVVSGLSSTMQSSHHEYSAKTSSPDAYTILAVAQDNFDDVVPAKPAQPAHTPNVAAGQTTERI